MYFAFGKLSLPRTACAARCSSPGVFTGEGGYSGQGLAAEHGEHVEIAVVDCDSYQFGGYRCPVGTPLYTTPEVHKRMQARSGWEPAGATVDKHRISSAPCKEPGFPAEAPLTKGHSDG